MLPFTKRPVPIATGFFVFSLCFLCAHELRAADPIEFEVGEFLFERPDGFVWINSTSPMRKAELRIPNPSAKPGAPPVEVTFFHFGPGQGGSPESNIARWLSQFQESPDALDAKTAEEIIGQTKVYLLSARGTFLSGMPGQPTTPQPDTEMRAAILTSNSGDVFVKMTGPSELVRSVANSFDKMILDAARRRAAATTR
jgi:hypothetical protein